MRDQIAEPRNAAPNPTPARANAAASRPPLVIGCGALARELVELTRRAGLPAVELTCLPASLHNRPERIPGAVAARIRRARADGYDRIFVAYADCGTGGLLDRVLEAEGVARLDGAHCYEVYAGRAAFASLHEEEPGTFYLTDYLVRNFERLVVRGLGLDRHPELLPMYFGNYRRLVYLAQVDDPDLTSRAQAAASTLGLAFERRFVGLGELAPSIVAFGAEEHLEPNVEQHMFQASNDAGQGAGEPSFLRQLEQAPFRVTEEAPQAASGETVPRRMEQVVFHGGSARVDRPPTGRARFRSRARAA
jgi:hypothetical protein